MTLQILIEYELAGFFCTSSKLWLFLVYKFKMLTCFSCTISQLWLFFVYKFKTLAVFRVQIQKVGCFSFTNLNFPDRKAWQQYVLFHCSYIHVVSRLNYSGFGLQGPCFPWILYMLFMPLYENNFFMENMTSLKNNVCFILIHYNGIFLMTNWHTWSKCHI